MVWDGHRRPGGVRQRDLDVKNDKHLARRGARHDSEERGQGQRAQHQ